MSNGSSKRKGGQFEREVCQQLSSWLSHGERSDLFWRSSMSGGRSTVILKQTGRAQPNQAGDISAIHPLGHKFIECFCVECKRYKDLRIGDLVYGSPADGGIVNFWEQVVHDAHFVEKLPMLIARQDRKPAILVTNFQACEDIDAFADLTELTRLFSPVHELAIFRFDDFLGKVPPDVVDNIAENYEA